MGEKQENNNKYSDCDEIEEENEVDFEPDDFSGGSLGSEDR